MSISGAAFFKNHQSRPAWRRLLFACLLVLPALPCFSQTQKNRPLFERIGEREGLPNSNISISGISQDGRGFLWFCTVEGLHRYDGRRFKTWKSDPNAPEGFSEGHLSRFLADRSGRQWALSDRGVLHLLDPSTDRFRRFPLWFSEKEKAPSVAVRCLLEDRQGRIWIGTNEHGLCLLDPLSGRLERQVLQAEKDREYITDIETDAAGNLWVSNGNTLFCLELPEDEAAPPRVLTSLKVPFYTWRLLPDKSGGVWLGGDNSTEIARFEPLSRRLRRFTYEAAGALAAPANNRVNALYEARDGRIWVGTNSGGISLLEPSTGKVTWLRHDRNDPQSLSAHCVTDIFEDKTGIVWVATWGGGLNKHDPQAARFGHVRSVFGDPQSLGNASVNAFCEDAGGIVWVGTADGLNRFDPKTGEVRRYDLPRLFLQNDGNFIYSIAPAPGSGGERLWVGTGAGLAVFDPATGTFAHWRSTHSEGKPLENAPAYFLTEDRNGVLWVISHKGTYRLFRFDAQAGAFRPSEVLDRMNDSSIAGGQLAPIVCPDRQHNVWIGTENKGFYRFDLTSQQLEHFTVDASGSTGFPTLTPGHALLDRKNRQWFGTDKGLYLLLPGARGAPVRFRRFTEREGLPSNSIQGMLEDEQGQIWISTFNGLSRFDPDKLTFKNYGRSDGLQGNEFGHEACFRAADGRLYFGGGNGFNVFSPGEIRDDTIAPQVAFTAVKVLRDNEMQDLLTHLKLEIGKLEIGSASEFPISQFPNFRLTHRDKVLTFEFAALHFADPERNQFAWKMEGFDPDWRYGGSHNEATYTNLDPGSYTFRVKAANKDGVWNEEGISLKIRVLPPWWRAWWAWLLYGAALVSGFYFYFKFRLERQAEQAEALRIKELERLKSRLYTNVTHEFRTPLTVILGMAERLTADGGRLTADEATGNLNLIKRNGKNLLRLVNQLLDLAKLESGNHQPEWVQADVVPFVQYLTEAFQSYAAGKKITLVFQKEVEGLVMDFDEKMLQSVVSNLLSNALKFTPGGGRVTLRISADLADFQNLPSLILAVSDTGVGIPAEDLPKIFDRFFQVDDSSTRRGEGTGIGLALTKELVELMGGSISVESKVGKGTTFTVRLPISNKSTAVDATNSPSRRDDIFVETRRASDFRSVGTVSESTGQDIVPTERKSDWKTSATNMPSPWDEAAQILIIEDNADVVTYIRTCLESDYHVLVAENGALGIEKALETVPDIILSDVMMPEKDGFEVCQTLKNDERTSHVPIVLLTAKVDVESRIEGLRGGADAYLAKPFDKRELLVVLEKLVELRRKLQAKYGSWQLAVGSEQSADQSPITNHPSQVTDLEDAFLLKIRHLIETNLADADFDIARLCRETGMSQPQLYRKIKALTGKSIAAWLRSFRLEKARELLLTSDLNVSEVAYQTGFSDPAYFSRAFSEAFGVAPGSVRK